jgi:hypothetical protein
LTTAVGERGQCRSCKKTVLWAKTDKNKLMPVDPGEIEGNANLELYRDLFNVLRVRVVKPGGGKHYAHFVTCEKQVQ